MSEVLGAVFALLEYFSSLRSANILQRVFLKEQIRESSIKEGPHREMRALKLRIFTD